MRKFVVAAIVAALGIAGVVLYKDSGSAAPEAATSGGPGGGRGAARAPMPVEFAPVKRSMVAERITIVGNLIGAATVEAVPKVNGRLQAVYVRLGDSVRRGQAIAKVEDREIQEQVNQAQGAFKVAEATIRQREADLNLARTNLERNRTLVDRQLLPRQTFDDTEARHQSAIAQLDLARAQFEQARARVGELRINLSNTVISSPVDGFVGKRYLDPGASVSPNVPVASIVDIRTVRMVAALVEKDSQRVRGGMPAEVKVDAFPDQKFTGRVSRVAPVFDPLTRTAEMEVEVANPGYRLKPGMYSRVELTVAERPDALTVPRNAIVELDGRTGIFTAEAAAVMTAKFNPVQIGIRDGDAVEITTGLTEGARVITTGAGALKDGDRIVAAVAPGQGAGRGQRGGKGQ
ncbi:MAG: efflux RND transporter periplasmic adaptor subunit [Acidobacteria bacterium]|nr:efflux RND transporter periplasmic adaptor subunit [Acidobacteriota bacterium]